MFQAVDARFEGVPHGLDAVGVGGYGQPEAVCLVHDRAQVFQAVLRGVRRHGFRRHPAATGHDLDECAAAGVALPYRGTQRLGAFDLSTEEVAVPARGGQRGTGGQDLRTLLRVLRQFLRKGQREIVAVTEIADGGDSGVQCGLGRGAHLGQQVRVTGRGQ